MKNYSEKLTMALSVFLPVIVLVFIWSAYLYRPKKEALDSEMKHEVKSNTKQHSFQSFDRRKQDKTALHQLAEFNFNSFINNKHNN